MARVSMDVTRAGAASERPYGGKGEGGSLALLALVVVHGEFGRLLHFWN